MSVTSERDTVNGRCNKLLALLMARFFNRTDVLCHKPTTWKGTACPLRPTPDQLRAVLLSHLTGSDPGPIRWGPTRKDKSGFTRGPLRIGSYGPAPDGTTLWVCVDADGSNHAKPLADPLAAALRIMAAFRDAGLACHLEKSKSGKGWHVWVFFASPVEAAPARRAIMALIPKDIPLAAGGFATPHNVGIEVFPKRDDTNTAAGLGNQVWLPWWYEAKGGGNQFHRETSPGVVEAYEPEDFEAVSPETLAKVAAKLEVTSDLKSEVDASNLTDDPEPSTQHEPDGGAAGRRRSRVSGYSSGTRYDGDREPERIESILDKALAMLNSTGHRHDTTLWLACQLHDNRHPREEAADAVSWFSLSFPDKEGDPYGETEALATLADVYDGDRTPRKPSGKKRTPKEGGADPSPTPKPKPKPPPYTPPPVTRGPAAPVAFDAGIDRDLESMDCPDSGTLSVVRNDGNVCTVSTRCGRCVACRRAQALDYLGRAEAGIGRDLQAGRTLTTFAGESSAGAMKSRLGKVANYLRYKAGGSWLVVASAETGASLPCGFQTATPQQAATVMLLMQQKAKEGGAKPGRSGGRTRPFALSNGPKVNKGEKKTDHGWAGPPRRAVKEGGRDDSTKESRSPFCANVPPSTHLLRAHNVRSLKAIAEALRTLDFDPPDELPQDTAERRAYVLGVRTFFDPRIRRNPRSGGRVQWSLFWNPLRPLTEQEVQHVLDVLDGLFELGPGEGEVEEIL